MLRPRGKWLPPLYWNEGRKGSNSTQPELNTWVHRSVAWQAAEDVVNHDQGRSRTPSADHESSATGDGERTGWKSVGERLFDTWTVPLVMPAQPDPGECRHKCKVGNHARERSIEQNCTIMQNRHKFPPLNAYLPTLRVIFFLQLSVDRDVATYHEWKLRHCVGWPTSE